MKAYAVLRWNDGPAYTVVADYGDFAWGSPLYTVIGYYPTRIAANEAAKADRAARMLIDA